MRDCVVTCCSLYIIELTVQEMKSAWEAEKSRLTKDLKANHEIAVAQAVKDTKKKQWVRSLSF